MFKNDLLQCFSSVTLNTHGSTILKELFHMKYSFSTEYTTLTICDT